MKLTEKQKLFADYYIETGNATEAYKRVYKSKNDNTAAKEGFKLLRNPKIAPYLEERNKQLDDSRIADMEEVKRFWSDTLRNEEMDPKHRLKASEYIAKTNAAFIEKQEISGETTHNINNQTDLSKLSVEELKEIESILSKAANTE
ncbi:phage terminase small subunit [Peribacillus simplex]|uniref:Phage terminase small subunit n=1 Tax=Peribacillus simplex TaxID=1478 RepID=A0A9X8WKY2_9BACI|nr:terminase small subunit [Peribacillus simplex]SIR49463.1 phage terminase small subunit [Peribacillus simplex]